MNITIRAKLVVLICLLLLTMSTFFTSNILLIKQAVLEQEEANVQSKVTDLIKQTLQGQVDSITLSIDGYYKQSTQKSIEQDLADEINILKAGIHRMYKNDLTDDPAMLIYTFINEYRWANGRYLFAFDADTLANEASGTDNVAMGSSYNAVDEKGNYYARDIVKAAKANDIGFSHYYFSNPATHKIEEKMSVAFFFEPLNLVIGTGEYVSTLKQSKIKAALASVGASKYGSNGYFWVQDAEGKMLVHPQKDLIGQSIANTSLLAKSLTSSNDVFLPIQQQNPETLNVETKLTYARKIFPDWGWTIATGAYESDLTEIQHELTTATKDIFDKQFYQSVGFAMIFLVLSATICVLLLNKIIAEMVQLKLNIELLSSGEADLTMRLDTRAKDELGDISGAVNHFIEYLQALMLQVSDATKKMTSGIERLHDQADKNRQAFAVHSQDTELVASAVVEMTATSQTVAEVALQSANATQQATEQAESSMATVAKSSGSVLTLVDEMVAANHSIQTMNNNTQEIAQVLNVIGSIAEQTNLLALNAAIEAARAGEQGRGFAVVADEVRTLAGRTQGSTAEIDSLLNTLLADAEKASHTMSEVHASCQRVSDDSESVTIGLETVTQSVLSINELTAQIATAAAEQNSVSSEISRNITSIETTAHLLYKNGEQASEATNQLAEVNDDLQVLVKQFKLA